MVEDEDLVKMPVGFGCGGPPAFDAKDSALRVELRQECVELPRMAADVEDRPPARNHMAGH
jgi:hypothetical protein